MQFRFKAREDLAAYLLNLFLFIYLNLCQTNVDSYLIKEKQCEQAQAADK